MLEGIIEDAFAVLEKLEAENAKLKDCPGCRAKTLCLKELQGEHDKLEAENQRLREQLEKPRWKYETFEDFASAETNWSFAKNTFNAAREVE